MFKLYTFIIYFRNAFHEAIKNRLSPYLAMHKLQIATDPDPRFKLNYICEHKLDVIEGGILLSLNLSLQNKLIELP